MASVVFDQGNVTVVFRTTGTFLRTSTGWEGDAVAQFTTTGELSIIELLQGAGAEIKVYDQDDPNGLPIGVIQFESLKFEEILSGTGTAEVFVEPNANDPTLFQAEHIWKVSIEGVERFAFLPEQYVDVPVQQDERQQVRVVGRGVGQMLDWAAVYPGLSDGQPTVVVREFSAATKGRVARLLMAEAQNRGTIPHLARYRWNDARGSQSTEWSYTQDLEFNAGGSLLELFDRWDGEGWEWHVDHMLRLRADEHLGVDRSDTVRLFPGHTVEEQETTTDRRGLTNTLMLQDGNEGVGEIADAPSQTSHGRREKYIVFADAIDEGTRTGRGYPLLNLWKNPGVERRVQISPHAEGRRPWVDFRLGDRVSVDFDGQPISFRVLAMGYQVTPNGREVAEVVLDHVLSSARRRSDDTGGGTTTGQQQLIYRENVSTLTITSQVVTCIIPINAFVTTYGKVGINLHGIASTALTLTVEFRYENVDGVETVKTWSDRLEAGDNTIGIPWIWSPIPEGTALVMLRLTVSNGTFTIQPNQAQMYVEAKNIAGQASSNPNIVWIEEVEYPPNPAELRFAATQVPVAASKDEPVTHPATPTDSTDVQFVLDYEIEADADDGWSDDTPTFNTGGDYVKAGNDGDDLSLFWLRFDIDVDLTGAEILEARLTGVADQTDIGFELKIAAEDAGDPAVPTNRSDLLGRSLTTETVDWDGDAVVGAAVTSPDLTGIVQELVNAYGNLSAIQFIVDDDGSPTNAKLLLGAYEHVTHAPVKLKIRYRE